MEVPIQRVLDEYGARVAQLTQDNVMLTASNRVLNEKNEELERQVASLTDELQAMKELVSNGHKEQEDAERLLPDPS